MNPQLSNIIKKSWGETPKKTVSQQEQDKLTKAYFDKLNKTPEEPIKREFTEDELKKMFKKQAYIKTGGFVYTEENKPIIETLFYYFTRNEKFYNSKIIDNKPSLDKGVLLIGNTGSGKTTILEIFKALKFQKFRQFSAYDFASSFAQGGENEILHYFKGSVFFDELGAEKEAMFYGKREEVGTRILEKRYNLFLNEGKKTHATTNLSPKQLTEKYGFRLDGRFLEMFNIIYLGKNANSVDFRTKNHK